jgi:hypothetical protein
MAAQDPLAKKILESIKQRYEDQGDPKMSVIFRIRTSTKDRLKKIAKDKGIRMSDVVQELLDTFFRAGPGKS